MLSDIERAVSALRAIPNDLSGSEWLHPSMAAKAAGVDFDSWHDWCKGAPNYKSESDCRTRWKSFDANGPIQAGTLYKTAAEHGWRITGKTTTRPALPRTKRQVEPRKPAKGNSASEVWNRCQPATTEHGYIKAKQGMPDGLRTVPAGDPLRQAGESWAGALVVPIVRPDGKLSGLQLIAPPALAERLKAKGKDAKQNLYGSTVEGWFTLGKVTPDKPETYIVEGIGQAWAVWKSIGACVVVTFGSGNMGKVAKALRQKDDTARLVLVPDRGKEADAQKIAAELGCAVACLPECEPNNFDVNDLFQRDGFDVVAALLESATEPPKSEPRYKLLGSAELAALPALSWRIRGALPADGLAGLYGPSASGKSFLALDAACAIASGQRWFDCRVVAAPVVYACLEGEAGFKLRAQAWEAHKGCKLPDGLKMILQPFKLTSPQDVDDLAAVVPAGAVVFIDTLNRAAPLSDENSSRDMGEILEAAKRLQTLTGGLVVLVHHTGKNTAAGLRGHSSLFAALDAAIEVSRDGDRREWKCAKSKDGADGDAHPFKLEVKTLGIDAFGDPLSSCVVVADSNAAEVQRVKLPQGGNQKLVYEGIRQLFKDGSVGKPGAPPLRPCIQLEAAVMAGAARLTCQPDRKVTRARDAITGLVARGVLGLNEGWLWKA